MKPISKFSLLTFVLSALLLFSTQLTRAQFITNYDIDNSGTYGRDCEIYSGSVTSKYSLYHS